VPDGAWQLLGAEDLDRDGYVAARTVVGQVPPRDVVTVIKDSGLRGRGGGGFSTGLKWEMALSARGPIKYLICNAD